LHGRGGSSRAKKEQTPGSDRDTAWRLFATGVRQRTVAEIAREAQVAEATVFTLSQQQGRHVLLAVRDVRARLADAGGPRPGEPALAAFRAPCSRRAVCSARTEAGAEGGPPGSARSTGLYRLCSKPGACSPRAAGRWTARPRPGPGSRAETGAGPDDLRRRCGQRLLGCSREIRLLRDGAARATTRRARRTMSASSPPRASRAGAGRPATRPGANAQKLRA